MAMSAGYRKGEINMTPMIDILLVLLIIFMVIQPQYSTGLDSAVPQPGPPGRSEPTGDVVIFLRSDGTVRLNDQAIEIATLEARLRDLYKRAAHLSVFIRAEKDVDFGDVAQVIDTANGVGIKKVGLLPRGEP